MDGVLGQMEQLTVSQCWALLRSVPVGRLAVVVDGKPEIFPLNHVIDHGTVVFRTAEGTKLMGTLGQDVAYEADGVLEGGAVAWSVVVKGRGREVAKLHESLESLELPLFPWHRGPKPRIIRIEPEGISGRQFVVTLTRDTTPVVRSDPE